MQNEVRNSGIDVIGNVPWGTHFCQFYQTEQDLIDILVPYFKAGLENNEFCMWVTSEPLAVSRAQQAMRDAVDDYDEYLSKGQIEIIPYAEWYLLGGTFDDDRVLAGWVNKMEQALARGYFGLRLTGNTFWLERNHWHAFTEYEAKMNNVIGKYRMLAICTYCLDRCDGATVIDVVKNHQFALIKQEGRWDIIESDIYKQAKEQIAHLASFPELNPNPVLELDIDGNIKYLNPAAEALFPDLASRGSQHSFLADWDDLLHALRQKEPHTLTRDLKIGDYWYEQTCALVPSTGDVRLYARDITESKQAEEALKESEERFFKAFHASPVGQTIAHLPEGRWVDVNGSFLRMLEYTREEVIGRTSAELNILGSNKRTEILQAFLERGNVQDQELTVRTKTGKLLTVLSSNTKITLAGQEYALSMIFDITERKRMEEALEESQQDMNRAQAVARTGSWRLDVQRNELLWSDESHRIFGIPKGTPMTYETFLSSVHPDDWEYVDKAWQAALQGEDYDIEHRIIVGSEVKWVREKAELEFDEQGMLKGGFGTVQDITEIVLAEEAIKQAAQQWQETFDAMPDLISINDRDYNIVKVNKAFAEVFGMTPEQLAGRKCYEVFHKSNEPIPSCPHRQTVETGQSVRAEIFEPSQDAYFDISTAPIVNASGETTSSVHFARDITERKKAEERMAFQSELLDTIEDSVIATDIEGRVTFWGKGTASLLGWQPEEVIGRKVEDFLIPEELSQKAQVIGELLRGGQGWSGEIAARCRDGALSPFLVRSSPVMDKDGKVIGTIAVGKDISDLKKIDKMKDEFIGLVSHELRTPLTVITGSIRSAMSPGISPEDAHTLLQNAAEGADSLAAILENMLELSRHQAGRLQLRMELVNITDAARSVIGRLKGQGAGQRFTLDFPDDLPLVEADPTRIERILYNLVENATKYSPEESEIKVSARKEGAFVITEVTDQGQGISPEDQNRLFELFEQLEQATRPTRGLGLGLVVCKRLVEAQGGWIKVDSEVGRGSTFSFALLIRRAKV